MSRIELTEQFYEDEVREGFYIPACVKQAWGAQIRVLNEVDRVCAELGIKYFADWGTFLGAVRHGGYIPWDDDFDICMLRDDYNRFLSEGIMRLPEGYAVYNLETKEDHEQFVANIVNRTRICFEPEHLKRFHGFPYICAVDVFLIDYMAKDDNRQEEMKTKAKYVLSISDAIREGKLTGSRLRTQLSELERLLDIKLPEGLPDLKIRQLLDLEAEKLFASFADEKEKSEQIVQMMPWGLNDMKITPKKYYSESVDIPFETGTIPVPLIYDSALRLHYGDYMQLYKNAGGHDYPFFVKSRSQLQEVLDFELPQYKVDAANLIKRDEERKDLITRKNSSPYIKGSEADGKEQGARNDEGIDTYKEVVSECLDEMILLCNELEREVSDPSNAIESIIDTCASIQQLAIDLGTYMEAVKGEGYDIVVKLEHLCEELYEMTQMLSGCGPVVNTQDDPIHREEEETDKTYEGAYKEKFNSIKDCIRIIKDKSDKRREILFLPFKDEYWKTFEPFYRQAMDDQDTDVYVVPIPYYYKDHMGQLINMQLCTDKYPFDIKLTHYDKYDYAVHHPDVIVIQNPYDNYNDEMSVPPFFYSDKLLELTDSLVYIPWFETYDFTRENEREYINMDYYCTMPGVINADTVILRSEVLKRTYIEKLCDFAGVKTRKLWEKKLITRDSKEASEIFAAVKYGCLNSADEKRDKTDAYAVDGPVRAFDKEGRERKTLLYYPDFSDIIQRGQQAVDKIKSVLTVFSDARNKESLDFLILKGRLIEEKLKAYDSVLYNRYLEAINAAQNSTDVTIELVNESETDYDTLVQRCCAYYGDGGRLAHMFRNAGKPVMIQNYEEA